MIKGRDPQYHPYNYLTRLRAPLAMEVGQRLVTVHRQATALEAAEA